MAFPLIPFVAGAVVGGLAAYFYRDEKIREDVKRTADDVSSKVTKGISNIRQKISASGDADTEAPAETQKKTTAKRSTRKSVSKKATAPKTAE